MMINQWTRVSHHDDVQETLTLVKTGSGDRYIQVTSGSPDDLSSGRHQFCGLFSIDGDGPVNTGNCEWEFAEPTADEVTEIEASWSTNYAVLERWAPRDNDSERRTQCE